MFIQLIIALVCVSIAAAGKVYYQEGELALQEGIESVIKRPLTMLGASELPENFDPREKGWATIDLNQHIPTYCGSCWAHAAYSSIADRMKRMSDGKERDIIPAVQSMINCGSAGSCNGGDSHAAYAWTFKNGGVPDVTSQQYQAKNMECTAENTAMDCSHDASVGCFALDDYPIVTITEYGGVKGEENIMNELYQRGPVAAYIDANCLLDYTSGVEMYDDCRRMTNHAIQIAGWGTENGTAYWLGRNSWGRAYGEDGWFKIVRGGRYDPGEVYWAVPEMKESWKSSSTYKKI